MKYFLLSLFILLGAYAAHAGFVVKDNSTVSQGLVGYWNFEEGAGDIAYDKSGKGNNGTLTNITGRPWTQSTTGLGNALRFDGVNDYVSVGSQSNLKLNNNFTWSYWFKVNTLPTVGNVVTPIYWTATGYFSGLYNNAGISSIDFGRTGIAHDVISGMNISANVWYHIVITVDGSGNVKIYINGALDKSGSTTLQTPTGSLSISGSDTYFVNGSIDEVRIYNRALSQAEITRLYNAKKTVLKSQIVHSNGTISTAKGKINIPLNNDTLSTGLVGYWPMDGKQTSARGTADASGNRSNGTFTGGNVTPVAGRVGQALSFDGVNDMVQLGTPATLQFANTQPFTISAWIKPKIGATGLGCIVTYSVNGNGWPFCYDAGVAVANGLLAQYYDGVRYTRVVTSAQAIKQGVWTHVVWTRGSTNNTSGERLYVNGVANTTSTNNTAPNTINYTSLTAAIGSFGDGTFPFNGVIDDVRIYNRALTPQEILRLYNIGR